MQNKIFYIIIFFSSFGFSAHHKIDYEYDPDFLQKPAPIGNNIFDDANELEVIDNYIKIINEFRQTELISDESKVFLNKELRKTLTEFFVHLEQNQNFLFAKPYWYALEREVEQIIEKNVVDIPVMHAIGVKLILIADLSKFSCHEMGKIYLNSNLNTKDAILYKASNIIRFITKKNISSIKEFLDFDIVNKYTCIKQIYLNETIPLFNETGLFAINSFFYAFFNKIQIQTYPFVGTSTVHAGYYGTYSDFLMFAHHKSRESYKKSLLANEHFTSSILLAEHDRLHRDYYRMNFYSSYFPYLFAWYKHICTYESFESHYGELVLLFFACHKINTASRDGILEYLNQYFKNYKNFCSNCRTKESLLKENELFHRLIALDKISDFAQLLTSLNLPFNCNSTKPWKNGPKIRKYFESVIEASEFFKQQT